MLSSSPKAVNQDQMIVLAAPSLARTSTHWRRRSERGRLSSRRNYGVKDQHRHDLTGTNSFDFLDRVAIGQQASLSKELHWKLAKYDRGLVEEEFLANRLAELTAVDKNGDGLLCVGVSKGQDLNPNSHWARLFWRPARSAIRRVLARSRQSCGHFKSAVRATHARG